MAKLTTAIEDYSDFPYAVLSRDGSQVGIATHRTERRCGMEGCGGFLVSVRWPDGKRTRVCCRSLAVKTIQVAELV